MLRASFLLASFRVIDIPSLALGGSWWPLTIERIAESCLCSRFIYTQKERTSRWFLTSRKKFFNAFHPIFFDSRERIIFEFFFFFFFFLLFIVVEGKIFSKGFGHVAEYISGNCVRIRIAFVFIIFFYRALLKRTQ